MSMANLKNTNPTMNTQGDAIANSNPNIIEILETKTVAKKTEEENDDVIVLTDEENENVSNEKVDDKRTDTSKKKSEDIDKSVEVSSITINTKTSKEKPLQPKCIVGTAQQSVSPLTITNQQGK